MSSIYCHFPIFTLLLALFCSSASAAETMNLRCESLTQTLIEQLAAQDLLKAGTEQHRAKQIALDLCTNAEVAVQQQHEFDKQEALENWFFEYHPEKPGNRRLKKTH